MAPVEGMWGERTATIDWCEENYVVSYYIAEFWNTISNAVMIFAPLIMMVIGILEKHEKRFVYSFAAIIVVGIGSWLFHMTLLYSMQLMDELPMIWGSAFIIYSMYMMKSDPDEDNILLQVLLSAYCFIITVVYIVINEPVFHEAAYGLMVFTMLGMAIYRTISMQCNVVLFVVSIGTYALGFFLWNIDNWYCDNLRYVRGKIPYSGMLFQLHAWWHVFAGLGTYLSLLFAVHTRYLYLQCKVELKFFYGFFPYVTVKEKRN